MSAEHRILTEAKEILSEATIQSSQRVLPIINNKKVVRSDRRLTEASSLRNQSL